MQITRSVTGKIRSHSPSTDNISQSPNTIPYTLTHSLIIPLRHFHPFKFQPFPHSILTRNTILQYLAFVKGKKKEKERKLLTFIEVRLRPHIEYIYLLYSDRENFGCTAPHERDNPEVCLLAFCEAQTQNNKSLASTTVSSHFFFYTLSLTFYCSVVVLLN